MQCFNKRTHQTHIFLACIRITATLTSNLVSIRRIIDVTTPERLPSGTNPEEAIATATLKAFDA